jgi:hypothetical protein
MVNALSRQIQQKISAQDSLSPHEIKVKVLSLETLATISKSMNDWSKELRVVEHQNSSKQEVGKIFPRIFTSFS